MLAPQHQFWATLDAFYEQVTSISGALLPKMPKEEKKEIIKSMLSQINLQEDIYMPTNPNFRIVDIILNSGMPMQSHSRVPIRVTFKCQLFEGPDKYFEDKLDGN